MRLALGTFLPVPLATGRLELGDVRLIFRLLGFNGNLAQIWDGQAPPSMPAV